MVCHIVYITGLSLLKDVKARWTKETDELSTFDMELGWPNVIFILHKEDFTRLT